MRMIAALLTQSPGYSRPKSMSSTVSPMPLLPPARKLPLFLRPMTWPSGRSCSCPRKEKRRAHLYIESRPDNLRLIHIFEAGKDKIKFELDRLSGIWRGCMWLNDGQYCPKIICLWAAISRKLASVESVICERRGERILGSPLLRSRTGFK
jgi:hypothetical protein